MRALVGYLFVLSILALWSGTAGAIVLTVTPPNPNANQSVTLTIRGLAPFLAVGYQVSETGGEPWRSLMDPSNPSSVYVCHHEPCTLVFPAPGRVTALKFRLMVVHPQTRQWVYGTDKTSKFVSWTAGLGGGTDLAAELAWNIAYGGFALNVAAGSGNLTGTFGQWQFTGRATNGADVVCAGGVPSPGDNAPGPIRCEAKWGSTVWKCAGRGRMRHSWSGYAGQWAWFGSAGVASSADDQCRGTITEAGKSREHPFGPVYIRSRLGL